MAEFLTAGHVAACVGDAIASLGCELRPDVYDGLQAAMRTETSERGRSVLGLLCENARIAARDRVPLCQDTGTVWVWLDVGSEEWVPGDVFSLVDEAVARAYRDAKLRMSVVNDALLDRNNTGSNTPAFCELTFHPGRGASLSVMLKGGGSDNASRICMLPPGAGLAGIEEVVLSCVREKAANACPPLIIGIGVGSTFDKVASLAKKALLRPIGVPAADGDLASIERHLLERVNATGIGPAALGGDTTALAVNIKTSSCHIAALPVAVNMGCSAMRSITIDLAGGDDER